MRIAIAQINPTVGDLEGNLALVRRELDRGREQGASLVVFPELCLTGYPPRDLLEIRSFLREADEALRELAGGVGETGALVGTVIRNPHREGRRLQNAAVLLHRGEEVARRAKTLLPTYDVFDEDRHFEPAAECHPVTWEGLSWGITICEDIWDEILHGDQRLYSRDPVQELVDVGAQIIVNISASPFSLGHPEVRREVVRDKAAGHRVPLIMANQVGGNDELIFDGSSLAFRMDGTLAAEGRDFAGDFLLLELDPHSLGLELVSRGSNGLDRDGTEESALYRALTLGTRDFSAKCGFSRAITGLSGGIDSSLTACVAVEALGAENVLGVAMPSPYSNQSSAEDARELAKRLGMEFREIPMSGAYGALLESLGEGFDQDRPDVAEENLQARIRASILMAISNKEGRLLLSTGNKSELAVGYCTLYGDMAGGLAVIADVPKTMVYRLSRWINRERETIPASILEKPPSAELKPNQIDQDTLPPYEELDRILQAYVEDGMELAEIVEMGLPEPTVRRVLEMIMRSEHKRRQAAPGLRVTSKAFGVGRRMPIAQRFHEGSQPRSDPISPK
jgi:NAD+ synthase (glutamine-hydrolysing)